MKWKKIDLPHDSRGLVPFVQIRNPSISISCTLQATLDDEPLKNLFIYDRYRSGNPPIYIPGLSVCIEKIQPKAPGIKNNYFDFIASKSSPSIISDDQSKGLDTYQNSAASQLPF
ncbi:hypothetical protein TWF569_008869 [Orbilia oligospora]|uniref:Uncharacterized protein n=1 Tax=Orbilia oligospora TaxID=2813651 RepID=A0A7C8NVD4_ORBOL|nr:hypothetical protein TWF703_003411 [Orbilia oligospora]KAF3155499.1 hypothetical protein TWF569_008869 [Orbilia oligospora]